MDPILERYQALEDKIKEYNPALDAQRLFRAFTYADNAHAGQLRKDGSPYITHPLAVAAVVARWVGCFFSVFVDEGPGLAYNRSRNLSQRSERSG